MKGLKAILYYFLVDLFTLLCWAQSKGGQHFGSTVVVSDVNLSNHGDLGSSEPPQTAEGCRGYFDVMGQWDPPFNCSSGEFLYCCGTCGFRYCCKFQQAKLDQSICTNYDRPNWLAPGKTPPKIDDPLLDPNRDKANLIVYIICGVVAVMVLVGIFTKLGLEKAHRPQRENMSRALADVMRQQGHCTADHMERDANLVVHVQHYETMPRSSANNLPKRHINDTPTHLCRITPDLVIGRAPTVWSLAVSITSCRILTVGSENPKLCIDTTDAHSVGEKKMTAGTDGDTSKINNVVPTSPHLPQMAHPHSYPTMGQISNPYEQQPPGKELNKYASLKAVAEKGNDDFYSKRRHLAELAAKGSLPLHPVRMEQDSPVGGTLKLNGQKSKVNKIHTHPLSSTYNPDYKTWDHTEHSLRRQAYATKKHCPVESVNEQIPSQNQHYIPPQPYFVTNSKTEVTV